MIRVMYRPKKSAPWEPCYLVSGRKKAIASAQQIADQEVLLGGTGQAGIIKDSVKAKKVTIVKPSKKEGK